MATNLDVAVAVLEKHREARMWNDAAVAADLLAQLGVDPAGEVASPTPVAEAAAEVAVETAAEKANAEFWRDATSARGTYGDPQPALSEAPPPPA